MATVAATGGSREARRRRIIERGADRLALITGQIQSLPPEPVQFRSGACPPVQTPAGNLRDFFDDVAQHEIIASNPDQESVPRHIFDETKEPLLENIEKRKIVSLGVEEEKTQIAEEQSEISSSMQNPAQVHQIEHTLRDSFTPGQISSAISASETIRMCCSVAAAVLVILSYVGFPILGGRIFRSVLISEPFYMLLLTNISIVVGRLVLGHQGAGRTSSVAKFGGNGLVDQMGKALELGLLLQKISGAMFIDFGVYAIVLVCGLSLVQRLGW
ncbi:hypothetical protein PHJA_001592300 [Phtheirospermum japonicum]|uniref:Uncharacterized protein n=1 Tax=Phtheirospermum japonicum TaxID=374723 RepID=A0A830C5U0_9LAMI|nr:hypothetical protein PHJA_001592300 [Phtheirospermum japonicum]